MWGEGRKEVKGEKSEQGRTGGREELRNKD